MYLYVLKTCKVNAWNQFYILMDEEKVDLFRKKGRLFSQNQSTDFYKQSTDSFRGKVKFIRSCVMGWVNSMCSACSQRRSER